MSTQIIDAPETADFPPRTAPPPRPAAPPFVLGAGRKAFGGVGGGKDVQIDGALRGGVEGLRLIVAKTGSVEGPVKVDDALIDGTVKGDVRAEGDVLIRGTVIGDVAAHAVCLTPSARVFGTVTQEILTIEKGAVIEGGMKHRPSAHPSAGNCAVPRVGSFWRQQERYRIIEKFQPMIKDHRATARKTTPSQVRPSGPAAVFGTLIATVVLLGGVLMWPTITLSQ